MGSSASLTELFGSTAIAYDSKLSRQIIENRHTLDNILFIDRLMEALNVDNNLYPPTSSEELRSLQEQIMQSTAPSHHKLSLIYYMVRDLCQNHRDVTEDFLRRSYLPKTYVVFIEGIWHLDRLHFDKAMDYLTEPSLIPTFSGEVMYTLCQHSPDGSYDHALAYYNAVSSSIESSRVLQVFFECLCAASVTEAFRFARSQRHTSDLDLFTKLLDIIMRLPSGEEKATKSAELILLPMDDQEEKAFHEYLGSGPGSKLPGAADTVIMRDIALSRQNKGNNRKKRSHRKIDGLDWSLLNDVGLSYGSNV